MRFVRTLFSALTVLVTLIIVGGGSLTLALVKRESMSLPPSVRVLEHHSSETSRMFASDGTLIGRFAEQDRTMIPLTAIPGRVVQAFVSAEDKAFWSHHGVDPVAIVRALLTNARNRGNGRRPLGASTIDQQVVKNLLVGDEASLRRKVREAIMAIRLDRDIGKPKIMELYLNEIYLGQGAYGVSAAAEIYFSKPLDKLTLSETAMLAGLPKAPTGYDPIKHPEAARARRLYVLQRMVDDGVVTLEEADLAAGDPLPVPSAKSTSGVADGYFSEGARREVATKFGSAALYRGGLTVKTTMDPSLQAIAEVSLRKGLVDYDRRHGWRGAVATLPRGTVLVEQASWQPALAASDVPAGAEDWRLATILSTGAASVQIGFADGSRGLLALADLKWARRQGLRGPGPVPRRADEVAKPGDLVLVEETGSGTTRHFELRQIPEVQGSLIAIEAATGRILAVSGGFSHEMGSFDRATQSYRQPGSTFKPFIYLTALERGYDATSPLLDTPVSIDMGKNAQRWNPGSEGDRGLGLIPLRKGLELSRNFASVRLLYDLGLDAVADTTRKLGVYENLPNFAAALGALETTDLKLTTAYAMFANGGYRVTPSMLDEVTGPGGQVMLRRGPPVRDETTSVADPVAIAQLRSILEGVVRRGTAANALSKIDLPIAGKTGTTNDNVDAWFVGFTPDIAVGVHVGFDRPTPLGEIEQGSVTAAPIFGDFIRQVLSLYPPSSPAFVVPLGAKAVKVDPVSGEPAKNGMDEVMRLKPGEETPLPAALAPVMVPAPSRRR